MRTFLVAVFLFATTSPAPIPPILTYPSPDEVVIQWHAGDCAYKSYSPNPLYGAAGGVVWLGCSGSESLPGPSPIDQAMVPHTGDRVWVVAPNGERSTYVLIALPHWILIPSIRH